MKERIGLIKIIIRLISKDNELIGRIIEERGLKEDDRKRVTELLRHNIWTTNQFRDITGYNESTIANKTRPQYRDGELQTELDFCYPFADLDGLGPKFIVRNEKSEAMLPQPIEEPEANDAV